MGLPKADILQAVMVGSTLVLSALAVPIMASSQDQPANNSRVHHIGQIKQ